MLAPPAEAQSGELRAQLDQFRNTLIGITDPHQLCDLEHGFAQAEAAPEAEAMRRLRRGWVRLRLGTLGDGSSLGRAADDFARATELEPGWSAAWQGRGLALRAEGDRLAADRLNLGKRVGFGPVEGAVESFVRAL